MLDVFDFFINTVTGGLYQVLSFLFGWMNVPSFPEALINSVNGFLDLIFDNLTILGFFIRPETLKFSVPLLIFLLNFELLYKLIMWIMRKVPFVGIE